MWTQGATRRRSSCIIIAVRAEGLRVKLLRRGTYYVQECVSKSHTHTITLIILPVAGKQG